MGASAQPDIRRLRMRSVAHPPANFKGERSYAAVETARYGPFGHKVRRRGQRIDHDPLSASAVRVAGRPQARIHSLARLANAGRVAYNERVFSAYSGSPGAHDDVARVIGCDDCWMMARVSPAWVDVDSDARLIPPTRPFLCPTPIACGTLTPYAPATPEPPRTSYRTRSALL